MGIRVECPHGHVFKVKDKYAGKRGLCPHCKGQVEVRVPEIMTDKAADSTYRQAVINENRAKAPVNAPSSSTSSIFDEHPEQSGSSTSGSLLGSSVIRHNVKCKCGAAVPMWYARCPSCGVFMENR